MQLSASSIGKYRSRVSAHDVPSRFHSGWNGTRTEIELPITRTKLSSYGYTYTRLYYSSVMSEARRGIRLFSCGFLEARDETEEVELTCGGLYLEDNRLQYM